MLTVAKANNVSKIKNPVIPPRHLIQAFLVACRSKNVPRETIFGCYLTRNWFHVKQLAILKMIKLDTSSERISE